jgi:methyl-accepting chemotaxis protein
MGWIDNLSMSRKLRLGFASIVVCLATLFVLVALTIGYLRSALDTVQNNSESAVDCMVLKNSVNRIQADVLAMMINSDSSIRQGLEADVKEQNDNIQKLNDRLGSRYQSSDSALRAKVAELKQASHDFYDTHENQLMPLIVNLDIDGAKKLVTGEQKDRYTRMVDASQFIGESATKTSNSAREGALTGSGIAIGILIIVGGITIYIVISSLLAMIANIKNATTRIGGAVSVLGAATNDILVSTTQSAANASQTASAVAETTSTVEEVRQTSQQASERAQEVYASAQDCALVTVSGMKATDETISRMKQTKEQMDSIGESMVRLTEKSQSIARIIATVDELAQQSRMLAVNAGLEAADAGEFGKRFKVVAREVRSMAEQSKRATAEVREILTEIQKATNAAAMKMEMGSKTVEAALEHSNRSGESIQQLAESAATSARAAAEISQANQQQLAGVDQVVVAMHGIKVATEQNLTSIEQMQSAAHNLDSLGSDLKQLVDFYQV